MPLINVYLHIFLSKELQQKNTREFIFLENNETVPAFFFQKNVDARAPLVVASAHSGVYYPERLFCLSALKHADFQNFEDVAVDKLFSFAPSFGIPLITGTYARAWVDLNRHPFELDKSMFLDDLPSETLSDSPRVLSGLGVFPKFLAPGRPVYKTKLRFAVERRRLLDIHHPYHIALGKLIKKNILKFGKNLLIDAHSMPDLPFDKQIKGKTPDFVLGDVNGLSCSPEITRFAADTLREMGYFVTVNLPYAGAYTTRRYGKTALNSHALQIEIARHLYWDAEKYEPTRYFNALWRHLSVFIEKTCKFMQG